MADETTQCKYGTAEAGTVNQERCERDAEKEYIQLDDPIPLCDEHFREFMKSDYYSGAGDY